MIPMARTKFNPETNMKRPRQTRVEADMQNRKMGIRAKLEEITNTELKCK